MTKISVEAGKFYALVPCEQCGQGVPVQELAAPQAAPDLSAPAATVTCPHCGHDGTYRPEQIERAQGTYTP